MSSLQKLGALAVMSLFAVASAAPADAGQHRTSGSSGSSGAKAAPRSAQGGGPSAGQHRAQGPGPASGPRSPQGPGPAARSRPPQAPGTGHAVPRPAYRPGSGGHYPGYGYRGRYPAYGYRGYYPSYGYRGYGYGYYPGFYWGFGAYFGPYYYSPWLYSSYWSYPGYYPYDDAYDYGPGGASLKVDVKPSQAEVYVDGHLAGIVDQFDGMFQSLPIESGGHEITIWLGGFRSIRQQIYLSPGSTYRIKGAMEPLPPGESDEQRPQAASERLRPEPQAQVHAEPQYRSAEPQGPPPDRQAPEAYQLPGNSRFGQVAIRVQPGDAEVLIDGEVWRNSPGADRLVVHLAPGTHRVEIRRDGYDPFVTAIEIRRGETTPLNVSLGRF